MFNCQRCKETSKHCEKPVLLVVEVRSVAYPERTWRPRGSDPLMDKSFRDFGGHGTQIVREERVCMSCALHVKFDSGRWPTVGHLDPVPVPADAGVVLVARPHTVGPRVTIGDALRVASKGEVITL